MKSGQSVFRVFNKKTNKWFKKSDTYSFNHAWVDEEHKGTIWKGTGPVKLAFKEGSLSGKARRDLVIVEYVVSLTRGVCTPVPLFLGG